MKTKTLVYLIGLIVVLGIAGFVLIRTDQIVEVERRTTMAFISDMREDNGQYSVSIEELEWLSGREGEDAAIEAGLCMEETRKDCLPNDYFIRIIEGSTFRAQIDPSATVVMLTLGDNVEPEVVSQEFLYGLIDDPHSYWMTIPFELNMVDGVVASISEVYVP